jgi:hypothetical protein
MSPGFLIRLCSTCTLIYCGAAGGQLCTAPSGRGNNRKLIYLLLQCELAALSDLALWCDRQQLTRGVSGNVRGRTVLSRTRAFPLIAASTS